MRNNHFFKTQILLAALAAAVIAPIYAFSQQRTGASRPVIKDSDIYVPDKVLQPSFTEKEAKDLLKECIQAFDPAELPKTYEEYLRQEDKNRRIGSRQCQSSLISLRSFIFDDSAGGKLDASGLPPVSPEIMEVTGFSDTWYKELYAKAGKLKKSADEVDKAVRMKNAALFAQACRQYAQDYDALEAFRKKPGKLSDTRRKQIADSNKAKRKREYIDQRKKQMMEEYEAQRAAEAELNRAAGASKKNK